MPRIRERYYYNNKSQAEDNLRLAKVLGLKATMKKLDSNTYQVSVY